MANEIRFLFPRHGIHVPHHLRQMYKNQGPSSNTDIKFMAI